MSLKMKEAPVAEKSENPGLAPFELSDYRGVAGQNFYLPLKLLHRYLKREIPPEDLPPVEKHLHDWGQLLGGELNDLIIECHQEGQFGYLKKYDNHGNRIDEIVYSRAQKEVKRMAWEAGIANLDRHENWDRPFHYEHKEACVYMANMNGESGYTCPLGGVEGLGNILEAEGSPEQKEKYLPLLLDPKTAAHFTAGQFLTERVGGSNVGANRTVARPGENGKWYLTGEKWFCSNPGEIWLTTARIEGTRHIGAFVMTRYKEDGSLNNHHILRTKDIVGTRGKVTAEMEYRNAEAEMIGRPNTGLGLIMKHAITISRIQVALGGAGGARRTFMEARTYARAREAFGKKIEEYPSVLHTLARMQVETCALEASIFRTVSLVKARSAIAEIMVPLMKYRATRSALMLTRDAILIHGGNGIIGDYSVLPRFLDDGIINETWEGTHNIIAGHVIKAFRGAKKSGAFFAYIEDIQTRAETSPALWREVIPVLKEWVAALGQVNVRAVSEANNLYICDTIYKTFALAALIEEACFDIQDGAEESIFVSMAEAFIEFIRTGREGYLEADSIFLDPIRARKLVEY